MWADGQPADNPASCPLVAVVVLNYRSLEQTLDCAASLRKLDHPNLRLIIVDNCSEDGSELELRRHLPDAQVLQTQRNLGYGDGNNAGIRQALAVGAEYVWIVTPDVRVTPSSLGPLLEVMRQAPSVGICGPVIRAGDYCITRSRVFPRLGYYPWHEVFGAGAMPALPDQQETDYVDGCALLMRRAMIEEIGLFREDFFMYFDETEYCLRARDRGWRAVVCGRSDVSTRSISEQRNNRGFYMVRNSILLARTRRRYVGRTVLRHLATPILELASLGRVRREAPMPTILHAVREALSMSLPDPPVLRTGHDRDD